MKDSTQGKDQLQQHVLCFMVLLLMRYCFQKKYSSSSFFFFLYITERHTWVFVGTFREQFWFFSELRINKSKRTASHRQSGYILQNSSNTPLCYSSLDIVSFPSFITLLGLKKAGFPKCDELSQPYRHYMIWNSSIPDYSGTAKFISCNAEAGKHSFSEVKLLTMWYTPLFFLREFHI